MYCVIICSGEINNYKFCKKYIKSAKYIIGVDGGATHIRKLSATPHLLLGDFDSIKQADLNYFKKLGVETLSYNPKKDKTDTEIAVDIAIKKGFKDIVILGGTGSRLDHTLANIFLLKKMLDNGVNGKIVDENNEIYIIKDAAFYPAAPSLQIKKGEFEPYFVSLLSLSKKAQGISTEGLYYPLKNESLHFGESRGISNKATDNQIHIKLDDGLLLVIISKDR